MKLKCRINGKDYSIVQGNTFAEEYNETLDSGTIIISGVPQIVDLKPYDDVFIYSGTFNGYPINPLETPFYRHLLVDQFSETLQNIQDKIYEYKIELFSETKKLETIQLPNTSITQPLKIEQKRSVWSYLKQYVEMYSPLYKSVLIIEGDWIFNDNMILDIKGRFDVEFYILDDYSEVREIAIDENSISYIEDDGTSTIVYNKTTGWVDNRYKSILIYNFHLGEQEEEFADWLHKNAVRKTAKDLWTYKKKYKLDTNLKTIFDNVYCPDFTLNAPSLKDVLTQLMLVKDMLPYVKDDIIYGLDITKRKGQFDFNKSSISNVIASMSSDNYANNLRRNYSNALSQEKSTRRVEYLGFRNSDDALLTIDNMRLETSFPIYKINKIYMCYYKKGEIKRNDGTSYNPKKFLTFMCKQDITKLVLLNSTRNLLSLDWNDFKPDVPKTVDELAQYRLCTVGYDIGSNYITGWGTKYEYPTGWWGEVRDKTYIQNIANILDRKNPYGIYTYGYITKGHITSDEIFDLKGFESDVVVPNNSNVSLAMKAFTFIVDYDAFYNGAVVHSKDNDLRDDITINDNSSSSLTLLEKDGLFQKEKLNRFGNKAIQINATYKNIDEMQPLGSVYDDDIIIYHREYSIYDNFVNVVYYGTKDYVLKNYFVSVYAKHRTYNLMSYGESVNRAENRKMYLMLSKDKSYFEKENKQIRFGALNMDALKLLLSAIIPSDKAITINNFDNPNIINAGYIKKDGKLYLTDANAFVSGYSMCFNTKMYDNASTGVYISDFAPQNIHESVKKDFTGSVQDWNLIADKETGRIYNLGFYVGHLNLKNYFYDKVLSNENDIKNKAYPRVFKLPYINPSDNVGWEAPTNVIGDDYTLYKDNKETIDMTLQFEPITNDGNILFSQWFMKLSELIGTYNKIDQDYSISDDFANDIEATIKYVSADNLVSINKQYIPTIIMEIDEEEYNNLDKTKTDINISMIKAVFNERTIALSSYDNALNSLDIEFQRIMRYEDDGIVFYIKQTATYDNLSYLNYKPLKLHRIDSFGANNKCPDGKLWFSNAHVIGNNQSVVQLYDPLQVQWSTVGSPLITIPQDLYNCQTPRVFNIGGTPDDFESRVYPLDFYIKGQIATRVYKKNMFIVYSNESLRKTLVYDELRSIDHSTDMAANVIKYVKDSSSQDIPVIRVDLTNAPASTKSIQYWYFNEDSQSYNFVFGANVNEIDITNKKIDINLSLLSTKDERVYDEKHNIIGEIYNYSNNDLHYSYGSNQYYKPKQ